MGGEVITGVLWFVVALLCFASLLPFNKVPQGMVRGLDFPRVQFFWLSVLLSPLVWVSMTGYSRSVALCLLVAVAVVQLGHFVRFTRFWPIETIKAPPQLRAAQDRRFSILAVNVKQSNRAYQRLIDLIRAQSPDIVLAVEVDHDWIAALCDALEEEFAHRIRHPQSNTYGICVMSRLPLSDIVVRDLVTEGVASVRSTVTLRSGDPFRLYVVHPEPPVPIHDTKGRDSEIALVGMEVSKDKMPSVVTGDLNDVAWSTTTRRFQRLSGLLDPRVGRGFYNTFHAGYPIARWPLDHLFHDARFRLIRIARLAKVGSDHFPMLFELALSDTDAGEHGAGEVAPQEQREVNRMIRKEKARDRDVIGADWEDD